METLKTENNSLKNDLAATQSDIPEPVTSPKRNKAFEEPPASEFNADAVVGGAEKKSEKSEVDVQEKMRPSDDAVIRKEYEAPKAKDSAVAFENLRRRNA